MSYVSFSCILWFPIQMQQTVYFLLLLDQGAVYLSLWLYFYLHSMQCRQANDSFNFFYHYYVFYFLFFHVISENLRSRI